METLRRRAEGCLTELFWHEPPAAGAGRTRKLHSVAAVRRKTEAPSGSAGVLFCGGGVDVIVHERASKASPRQQLSRYRTTVHTRPGPMTKATVINRVPAWRLPFRHSLRRRPSIQISPPSPSTSVLPDDAGCSAALDFALVDPQPGRPTDDEARGQAVRPEPMGPHARHPAAAPEQAGRR